MSYAHGFANRSRANFSFDDYSGYGFLSPFDGDRHGSHVASNAAENAGVSFEANGLCYGREDGMAPRARIAFYKDIYRSVGTMADEARCMALDDHYVNSDYVKRVLRADQMVLAKNKIIVLFTKDGVVRGVTRRDFTCHHGGFPQNKHSEDVGKVQRNRKLSRCGCQLYLRILKRVSFDVAE